jgi:TolB-like protein
MSAFRPVINQNFFMVKENVLLNEELFSEAEIIGQLEKILEHALFSVSDILSRFLTYIINETISGRSECLKEYNIARSVLNKSADFNSNKNGVVRVHAKRLRNALDEYYIQCGIENCCEITIPIGSYVPRFKKFRTAKSLIMAEKSNSLPESGEGVAMAVLPFKTFDASRHKQAVTESVGQLLSIELDRLPNFSVLSYCASQHHHSRNTRIREIAGENGVTLVLTGTIQFDAKKVHVFVQLINAATEIMLWSDHYTLDAINSGLFAIGEVIAYRTLSSLAEFNELFDRRTFSKIAKLEVNEQDNMDVINIKQTHRNKKTVSF